MDRTIFKRCLIGSLASLAINSYAQATSLIGEVAGKIVSDPASHAYLGPIMQMTGDSFYVYAKNYFQHKFFPEQSITTSSQLSEIRESKLAAVQVSTVDSLAIATQQKKTLRDDHQQLQNIKLQAEQNSTLQYQTNMQTRLLEHIAHQLDKLILIQSQQLELMATYMAQAQPTVFKKMPISQKNESK